MRTSLKLHLSGSIFNPQRQWRCSIICQRIRTSLNLVRTIFDLTDALSLLFRINPEYTEAKEALASMRTDPNVTETSQAVITAIYDEFEEEYDSLQLNGHNYSVRSPLL